ncbi:MAG TPA: proteinase inhibitor [Nitrospiraceae bacterium]|nr:proteinase inhibitor [Nitrospiraceae bacterium]
MDRDQMTRDHLCGIYGRPDRPDVRISFQATREFCGASSGEALQLPGELEILTASEAY